MGRLSKTQIKEGLEELKKARSSQQRLKLEKRVECLILLKEGRFKTQREIADYLGVSLKTIDRWLRVYRQGGIKALTAPLTRKKPSKIITVEIHNVLKEKLQDPSGPFLGYWHAREWVNTTFGVDIAYAWLRKYMKTHFKSKLKVPRKSHVEKDPQAEEAFFKTAYHFQGA